MRLLELEIRNVRGIRSLALEPNGENLVVWGPNGAGKSAVVDAIDFLLTGRISRLRGEGTGDISLRKHGPHVDHKPEETMVRGLLRLPGLADPVEVKRSIEDPDELACDAPAREHLEPILALAKQGQHVLTRRDILRYVAADTSTRAKQIQELMNLSEVEKLRRAFVSVRNRLGEEIGLAKVAFAEALGAVSATAQLERFDEEAVLATVNKSRAVLDGTPISALCSQDLKAGLTARKIISSAGAAEMAVMSRYIENLRKALGSEHQARMAGVDKKLRALLKKIASEPELLRSLKRLNLTKLGLGLIDETGRCPLCDNAWPPGELSRYLQRRVAEAGSASDCTKEIRQVSGAIAERVGAVTESLRKVAEAARDLQPKNDFLRLQSWLFALEELSRALDEPLDKYEDPRFSPEGVKRMLAPSDTEKSIGSVERSLKAKYPEATPQQVAWDVLTRLEENVKAMEGASAALVKADLSHRRGVVLLESFLKARDKVLGTVYETIKDSFVGLYRRLHGVDEGAFSARIEPEEAGLNFEVDFFGRGLHPPRALHSEGHQDSMGLCLYLALAEHLTKGIIDIVILDDVVMSIDADHRRQVCQLLAKEFPHRQFLITTHDRTWARQLRNEGVAGSNGVVEFYKWDLDTGPYVSQQVGLWDRIHADLDEMMWRAPRRNCVMAWRSFLGLPARHFKRK